MIKPYNTTIEHTQGALAQGRGLRCTLSALLLFLFLTPLSLTSSAPPALALPLSPSPLERLKLLLGSEGGREEGSFEVSARSLEWLEGAQRLSLKGEVRLWRALKAEGEGAQRVELRCEGLDARFNPQGAQRSGEGLFEGLISLTFTGGVSLSAPGLSLTAQRARWEASEGLLSLTGEVVGRWGAQRVRATQARVWLERGALVAEGVRATLKLPKRRLPHVSLER